MYNLLMKFESIGIREFSRKLFEYLKSDEPVVIMKHGKPFRVIQPIGEEELAEMRSHDATQSILKHNAIGLWKDRWPESEDSSDIVQGLRDEEEQRSQS
jgi:prevent-host-death family protein